MTEIKISDEDVAVVGFALCERASLPACDKLCEDCADDGRAVLQALVASGWRREEDVLRDPAHECMYSKVYHQASEALDELLGPNEEDGCGQGLVAEIWHLARRCEHFEETPEAEQYVSAGTREGEDQKRDEEQEHG